MPSTKRRLDSSTPSHSYYSTHRKTGLLSKAELLRYRHTIEIPWRNLKNKQLRVQAKQDCLWFELLWQYQEHQEVVHIAAIVPVSSMPTSILNKELWFWDNWDHMQQRRTHISNSDPPYISPKPDINPTVTYNSRRSIHQYNISPVYQDCEGTCINLQRVAFTAPMLGFTTIQFTKTFCSAHRPVLDRSSNPHLTHTQRTHKQINSYSHARKPDIKPTVLSQNSTWKLASSSNSIHKYTTCSPVQRAYRLDKAQSAKSGVMFTPLICSPPSMPPHTAYPNGNNERRW